MADLMLAVDSLDVFYGSIRAVDGASLRVEQGETVALIGSNGAGKSTLLKTISGLMRARSGTIRYAGADITQASTDRIVRLGLSQCPEGRRVFGRMTVRENLVLGGIGRPAADVGSRHRPDAGAVPSTQGAPDAGGGDHVGR